jgi:hypothetical protein
LANTHSRLGALSRFSRTPPCRVPICAW